MKRILLKLSGEMFLGTAPYGISSEGVSSVANQLARIQKKGYQLAVVIGGGNIFRGIQAAAQGFERVTADQMGMLATVFNGIALREALSTVGVKAHLMGAFAIDEMVQAFDHLQARDLLAEGKVLIFVGGTGNPFFSTDSGAALRASQIQADLLLKATKVDGVFSSDPKQDPTAKKFIKLSHQEAIEKRLAVMDSAALVLCRDSHIPIRVVKATKEGELEEALDDRSKGTLITEESENE